MMSRVNNPAPGRQGIASHGLRTVAKLALALAAVSCSKKISPNSPDPFPDLHVVSVNPSNNAVNVTASTNVAVTFSAEVPVSTLGIVLAPAPQNFYATLKTGGDPKQIVSTAALAANTAYSLVVFSAQDNFSDRLRAPYVSRFTTGSSLPSATVSGISATPFNEPTRGFVGLLRKNVSAIFEASAPDQEFFDNLVAVAALNDTSGAFTISHVAPGTYWPFSALDVDRNGRFSLEAGSDRLQAYDSNSNFIADSIVVANTALSDIALRLPVSGLKVQSTFPANGAKSVALQTRFRLTFNAPVIDSTLGLFVAPIPEGLSTSSLVLSPDGRELSAEVTLKSNTTYTAVLYTAKGTRGQTLSTPLQISFTTGAEFPKGIVRGKVLCAGGTGSPKNSLVGLLTTDFVSVILRILPDPSKATEVLRSTLAAITYVQSDNGEYIISNVPDGTYWPAAAKDQDLDGGLEPTANPPEPIGFYDFDGDNAATRADSVKIFNGNAIESVNIIPFGTTDFCGN